MRLKAKFDTLSIFNDQSANDRLADFSHLLERERERERERESSARH
jgi:hypothetical protein